MERHGSNSNLNNIAWTDVLAQFPLAQAVTKHSNTSAIKGILDQQNAAATVSR